MAQKISVIIPNYNGKDLLAKNLPKVIKYCPSCELIVVDDASTDKSTDFIAKNYKQVKVIKLRENRGFAHAVNVGVEKASGDLILLLNSDVSPRSNLLQSALSLFKNTRVFAVGLADYSHEDGKVIIRGRGGAVFDKGFVKHFALTPEKGETLWVSGGSGFFDRKKFLELKGFDANFAPFYWEDIDLSFRAWRKGFVCLFESKSELDHFHQEGIIKKSKSPFFIKSASYKNQFVFVWKNISDLLWLVEHLLWFPYHFAKAILTFDFAFIAGFLWALSQIPSLIFNSQFSTLNFKLSDREVLNKFAKP